MMRRSDFACPDPARQIPGSRRSLPSGGLRLLAIAAVLSLVASCTAGTGQRPAPSSGGFPEVSQTVGPSGMTVRFPGGWVDVPAGAVAGEKVLHVRAASPMSSSSAARLMHSLAAGITVDLSGLQPQRPLSVALPVPQSLPAGVSPQALFVAAVESPGAAPRLLATRYDGTDHTLLAQASHLSSFYPVWLDGQAVAQWLASTMVQVLQIRVPRPACADQPFALPDGSTLKFTSGPWSAGSDPLLWGCLAASISEPGDVVAVLTDNRPMGYSVQIAPGASVVRDPPTLDSSTARLLFDIASAGNARNLELLTAASTIRISVPADGLPSAGAPVIVAAVRANMAVVAASAAQSAFLILEGLLQVIAAPESAAESAALTAALDASGNIDCITGAVTAPGPVGLDQVLGGTQLGLRCLGSVLKGGATGIALTVLAAVTSFIATFTGALNLVLSQLTGTDTFTVALQRSPATSIPSPLPEVAFCEGPYPNCVYQYHGIEPTSIYFSGDNTVSIREITWSSWNDTSAAGSGTWYFVNCTPDCATGPVTKYPATLSLSNVQNGLFTVLTTTMQGKTTTYNYTSNWPQSAEGCQQSPTCNAAPGSGLSG